MRVIDLPERCRHRGAGRPFSSVPRAQFPPSRGMGVRLNAGWLPGLVSDDGSTTGMVVVRVIGLSC